MTTPSSGSSLAVVCPSCSQALRIKGFKPGRYSSRCPHCHASVRIQIDERPDVPPRIELVDAAPSVAFPGEAIPETLGGYRLERKLGQGGMGTVYLAKQLSLDRHVALKVLSREWVEDPRFLVRFIREAHAAAKLIHHNIVQIYDIGSEGQNHFFSMEYVQGQTLSDLVRKKGRLDVPTAVDYIIQSARGLQFAHQHGLVHRDIKPDNLMVNEHGVVKVADLGLVKTSDTEEGLMGGAAGTDSPSLTRLGTGMGTPAYIAPEQARDATQVDARADIYSLGCTLFVLLTGQPPFKGETAMEVMIKHLSEPPQLPAKIKPGIPGELWAIIARMLAKKPDDRFANMGEVVEALERFRQIRPEARAPGTPSAEEANSLSRLADQFNDVPLARAIPWVIAAWLVACVLLLGLFALNGLTRLAIAMLILAPMTLVIRALLLGFFEKTALFTHSRKAITTVSLRVWLILGGVSLLLVVVFYFLDLLVPALAALATAMVFGSCFYGFVDFVIAHQRRATLDKTQRLLQRLRTRSLTDEDLRRFVAEYAGSKWEGFYETLFGFDALQWAKARQIRDASGKPREFQPTLRERFLLWLQSPPQTKEAASALAEGVNPAPATPVPPESHSP